MPSLVAFSAKRPVKTPVGGEIYCITIIADGHSFARPKDEIVAGGEVQDKEKCSKLVLLQQTPFGKRAEWPDTCFSRVAHAIGSGVSALLLLYGSQVYDATFFALHSFPQNNSAAEAAQGFRSPKTYVQV